MEKKRHYEDKLTKNVIWYDDIIATQLHLHIYKDLNCPFQWKFSYFVRHETWPSGFWYSEKPWQTTEMTMLKKSVERNLNEIEMLDDIINETNIHTKWAGCNIAWPIWYKHLHFTYNCISQIPSKVVIIREIWKFLTEIWQ